jgi:hypothetical protein
MRVQLSDPSQMRALYAFFAFDPDAIVTMGEHEIEVSFLGSLNSEAQELEASLRLRSWLTSHPDVVAAIRA